MTLDAIVLCGGRSARLGGDPKSELVFEGATLLERTLAAVGAADRIVVVGTAGDVDLPANALVVREDPPFGGPVAAIGAGMNALGVPAEWVIVVACDMPRIARAIDVLVREPTGDGVVAVDDTGRRQPLAAVYRGAALAGALRAAGDLDGLSMRSALAGLAVTGVSVPPGTTRDIDTVADAAWFGIATTPKTHEGLT